MDIITIIAVIIAFTVKGITGFANTLVFESIMSYSKDSVHISPIDLLIGAPSNVYITWKERKNISLSIVIPLSLLVLIGIVPGTIFLKIGDVHSLKVLFGIVVIAIGVETLLRERQAVKQTPSRALLITIGLISGILSGLFGIGALLVAYINRTTEHPGEFRGNICAVFLVENVFRIILYSVTGILTLEIFKSALLLLPFMAIGLAFGTLISSKLSEHLVKKIVIILLIISGLTLVINNF